jgi:hypothetical protein
MLQNLIFILLGAFILYRIYLRVRRTLGWQQFKPGRTKAFTVIFCIVGLIFLIEGAYRTVSLISDVTGILIGVALAYFGAATTRFERREGSWNYRPNTWIGSIVTVLFLGRLALRIYDMLTMPNASGLQGLQTMTGGWTAGLLLIMFAYYIVYNSILLIRQKQLAQPE